MPLVTQGTWRYQHPSLPWRSQAQGDTNSPIPCGGRPYLDTNTPTILPLIQHQLLQLEQNLTLIQR